MSSPATKSDDTLRVLIESLLQSPDDPLLFNEFETLTRQTVFLAAYGVLKNFADAEDITQEVYIRIFKKLRTNGFASMERLMGYCHVASRRCALTLFAQMKQKQAAVQPKWDAKNPAETIAAKDPLSDAVALANEKNAVVRGCLASLPLKLRDVMILSTIEEQSDEEIAAALDLSISCVKMRRSRALNMLRRKLKALGIESV